MASGTSKTQFMEDKILNYLKGTAITGAPATAYLALFTTAPTDQYTVGTPTGTEMVGNAYARQAITWGAIVQAGAGTGDTLPSSAAITYPASTPAGFTAVAVGIFDALTAGNLLYWNTIASTVVGINGQFTIASGSLTVVED